MSYLGGIGGRRGPVPPAPNTQNRDLQNLPTSSTTIKSAKWGRSQALLNDPVPLHILLNKPAFRPIATVEIYFNPHGAQPLRVDVPITVPITGLTAIGHWRIKAPNGRGPYTGYFTFRVKIDNQIVTSDALTLTNDPVARVVRRNNTDGFDR